MIHKNVL